MDDHGSASSGRLARLTRPLWRVASAVGAGLAAATGARLAAATGNRLVEAVGNRLAAAVEPPNFPVPPRAIADAEGRTIELRADADGAFEALVEMYVDFDPAERAQGTPPIGEAAVREWLASILGGVSAVAWHGDRAVGHVAFVPDGTDRHELAIFVHQDYQRAGVGTALLRTGLGHARERGVGYVWLSVEVDERGIQKLYSDVGFSVVNPMGPTHRMSTSL